MNLLEILLQLRDELDRGEFPGAYGICYYLGVKVRNRVNAKALFRLFETWPEGNNVASYPIPSPNGGECLYWPSAEDATPEHFWDRSQPYGAARYRLLEYLIQELSKG